MSTLERKVSRRHFLKSSVTAAPALLIRQSPIRFTTNPFTLGVASGYPLPGGFVLWTRLAPVPLLGGGMPPSPVRVQWQVASDERMANVVKSGVALASSDWAHSLHIEVEGLEPDRPYWYRFDVGNEESAIGRTRTAPPLDSTPERLRFAFVSCQHYEQGYYSAYRHMIADELDLVVHLGDYIYEGVSTSARVRQHSAPEPVTLAGYRNRYAEYKRDEELQSAHAAAPWLVTWDDHEVDNDYANLTSEELHPEEWFRRRREAAYRAYYEHMPLPQSAVPLGEHLRLYREFAYGQLARFQVLDDRQYRSPQACPPPGEGGSSVVAECLERLNPSSTLLGEAQEAWLERNLDRSTARWNVLAQQTLMSELDRAPGAGRAFWTDGWDGYPAARSRLLEFIADRSPSNPVVIGGDVHAFWVSDLKTDFRDEHATPIASELVGSSITSSSGMTDERRAAVQKENPHIQYGNTVRRGYVRVEMTEESTRADLRGVDDVTDPKTGIETLASFVIEDGRPGPRRI